MIAFVSLGPGMKQPFRKYTDHVYRKDTNPCFVLVRDNLADRSVVWSRFLLRILEVKAVWKDNDWEKTSEEAMNVCYTMLYFW